MGGLSFFLLEETLVSLSKNAPGKALKESIKTNKTPGKG